MGSSSSKPEYPFPVPRPYNPSRSKSRKWPSFSTMRRSKGKDREKYSDFIMPKYPSVPYGLPYYQSTLPTAYYAPVQMAVLPYGVQQPVLAMPQPYVQMATYSTAPVQPAVAPAAAIQQVPVMQMPAPTATPAPMPAPAPAPPPVMPQSFVPPPTAPTRIPQPYPVHEPTPTQRPVIPRTPVISNPVIPPPPPIITSEPRPTDSARPRFTGFYRPADLPPPAAELGMSMPTPMPEPEPMPEPVFPSTTGPPGRTPYRSSMPMPMPMPTSMPSHRPVVGNPLPPPPADVWESSPYRQVLANLPTDVSALLDVQSGPSVLPGAAEPSRSTSLLGGLFGSGSHRDKGKGPLRGLFRSRSTSARDDVGSSSGSRRGHSRSQTVTSFVIPAPAPSGAPSPGSGMPVPTHGPPIRFDHTGEYAGFVNHSNHRVMYKNRMYPTALHLLEAMKFTHKPELQERIRTCKDVHDMYPLSASFQEHVRSDWGQVFVQVMEDVLYLKFKQHPALRTLLLDTGLVDIIYKDENAYWGDGRHGDGANELGKALVRVRERLRQEGER